LLKKHGIITGIITGENVQIVKNRAKKLELNVCMTGVQDKLACVREICKQYKIDISEVAYVGDDINDLDVLNNVGIGCCVADACDEVKKVSKYISQKKGGDGAVRDIIDHLLSDHVFISTSP